MAETIFDGDVTGPVVDADSGVLVANISGGTCTFVSWGLAAGSQYTFRNLDLVYMLSSSDALIGVSSKVVVEGKDPTRTHFTTSAGTWSGFRLASSGVLILDNVRFTNVDPTSTAGIAFNALISSGDSAAQTGIYNLIRIECRGCLFDAGNLEQILDLYGKDNCTAYFADCVFVKESPTETLAFRYLLYARGHFSATEPPVVTVRNSTAFWEVKDAANTSIVFKAVDEAIITLQDCIITTQNTGTLKTSKIADATGAGSVTSLGNNFIYTYVEAQNLGTLLLLSTDQTANPLFTDSAPPGVDLAPDGSVGSPQVYLASSDDDWPGAEEPFNLGTLRTVAGAGVPSLYGEVKQRIYEKSFGTQPTRGRGIRIRLRSRDSQSLKTYAGLWVRHTREEPK